MAVAILHFKKDNTIHDLLSDVREVHDNKIIYVGGSVDGWNTEEIGVIVVDTLFMKNGVSEVVSEIVVEDAQGNVYKYGDVLPDGLVDLSEQFKKKTFDNLVAENKTLTERLEGMESALVDLILGGM